MDLFQALPALRHHPLLGGKKIALLGVSAIVHDASACYFEIARPRYWQTGADDTTVVGVGGIGGGIQPGESVLACLGRGVQEEIGVRPWLETPRRTYLVINWQIADTPNIPPTKKRPTPLMIILVPPQLGGPDTPDHLAILAFQAELRGIPRPCDLFGLLRVEKGALAEFFARDAWPMAEAATHPAIEIMLNSQLPSRTILRPVLTARAFQLLVRRNACPFSNLSQSCKPRSATR